MEDKRFPNNLSQENQILQSQNRRLRERLLQLYLQINQLTSISEANGIPVSTNQQQNHLSSKKLVGEYSFVKSERMILPNGAIYSATFNPKVDKVALAALNGSVTICSPQLKTTATIQAHSLACRDVFWSDAGLISCGFDKIMKIWDVEHQTSQDFYTGGLTHAVCGSDSDSNVLFAAASDNVFWVDKRRPSPITISVPSPATAVSTFDNLIIYGDYDGVLTAIDRRALHEGNKWEIPLGGGAFSHISKVLPSGKFVVTTAKSQPILIELDDEPHSTLMAYEAPMRFGCRADITEKNLIFSGDFATLCGGRMAGFCDGLGEPFLFEDVGGFDYGAIFINNIAQKVLTYSEDGVITVYSLKQL